MNAQKKYQLKTNFRAQKEWQKRNRFHVNKRRRLWRQRPEVKERERIKAKENYDKNREKILENVKQKYRKYYPKRKLWREKNRERINHRRRELYQLNKEKINQRKREWYAANKVKARNYQKTFSQNKKFFKQLESLASF